jgi:hypothetical protein
LTVESLKCTGFDMSGCAHVKVGLVLV